MVSEVDESVAGDDPSVPVANELDLQLLSCYRSPGSVARRRVCSKEGEERGWHDDGNGNIYMKGFFFGSATTASCSGALTPAGKARRGSTALECSFFRRHTIPALAPHTQNELTYTAKQTLDVLLGPVRLPRDTVMVPSRRRGKTAGKHTHRRSGHKNDDVVITQNAGQEQKACFAAGGINERLSWPAAAPPPTSGDSAPYRVSCTCIRKVCL